MDVVHPDESLAVPGAGGLIRRFEEGEEWILIQERLRPDAPEEQGLIEIPAGKIRAFENIYECLRREIREETGYVVTWIQGEDEAKRVAMNGYEVLSYEPYVSAQNLRGTYPVMVQTFLCEVSGHPLEHSDEARNLRWVPRVELGRLVRREPELFYPMHLAALVRYTEG